MNNNAFLSSTILAHLPHAQYLKELRSYTLLQSVTSKKETRLLYLMWIQRSVPRIKMHLTPESIVAWSWLVAGALPATARDARRKQLHYFLLLMATTTGKRICPRTRPNWSLLWQDILAQKSHERGYTHLLQSFSVIYLLIIHHSSFL